MSQLLSYLLALFFLLSSPVTATNLVSSTISGTDLMGNQMNAGDAFGQTLESCAFVASLALSLPTDGASIEAETAFEGGGEAAAKSGATRLLTAGTDVPNAGGVIRSFAQQGDQTYYRVFSGSQQGRFLTAVPPSSSAFAREALALPQNNQAAFIQEVLVPNGTILQRSRALPAFGARGGAEQFELLQNIPNGNFGPGTLLP
jgi:hypothetical protein